MGKNQDLAKGIFANGVTGVTKSMVGLGSADNTTDTAKPVSTATQTALNLKADTSTVNSQIWTHSQMPVGSVLQVVNTSTDAETSTTSSSGFEAMRLAITPKFQNSKIIIMGTVYGSGNDDAHSWLEYSIGGGAWQRNTLLNGDRVGGIAFGDVSITRAVGEKTIQVGGSTHLFVSFNTLSVVEIRVMCAAENTGGFWLNSGSAYNGIFNDTSTKSTLIAMEVKQ